VLSAAVGSGILVLVATPDQRVIDVADVVTRMRSGRVVTSS
jgi:hypothetical protein